MMELLSAALERRREQTQVWLAEGTDCWRCFHGIAEGYPGIALDRYGDFALLQLFRDVDLQQDWDELAGWVCDNWEVQELIVWQRRPGKSSALVYRSRPGGPLTYWCREQHQRFAVSAVPRGQDAQLFLDLRVGRRWLRQNCQGKSVLNLFAYTCGAGVAAEAGGASAVVNVDFSQAALDWGRQNAEANQCQHQEYWCEEFYPVAWQLAGRKLPGRTARRPQTMRLKPRAFDIVFLDPPARSKGFFGAVDLENDYPGLLRPCLELLAPGGVVVACNNLSRVSEDTFLSQIRRSAKKSEIPLTDVRRWLPEADFPSLDQDPPLKVVWVQTASEALEAAAPPAGPVPSL